MSTQHCVPVHPVDVELFHWISKILSSDTQLIPGGNNLPQSVGFIIWAPWMSGQNVMAIHLKIVEICHSDIAKKS